MNENQRGKSWYPRETAAGEMKSRTCQTGADKQGWKGGSRSQNKVTQTCSPGLAALERKVLGLGADGERTVLGKAAVSSEDQRRYLSEREIIQRHYPGKEAD